MNKAEEILEKHTLWQGEKAVRTEEDMLLAMEEYAEWKLKNCNLQNVSKSFVSGSKVKITGCFIGHEFEIGEMVTLIEENGEQWLAENSKGERWYIIPEETNAC